MSAEDVFDREWTDDELGIYNDAEHKELTRLREQVAALTEERDGLETECAVHAVCTKARVEQLAAAIAREERLREALRMYYKDFKLAGELLAAERDTTALDERLAAERHGLPLYKLPEE